MKLDFKSKLDSNIELLNLLVPFNGEPRSSSIEEYIKVEGEYYRLFDSSLNNDQVLVQDLDIWQGFQRIIDFYDWANCFHPLDIVQWQKVLDHLNLGGFFDSPIFAKTIQNQKKLLKSVILAEESLVQLMLTKKVDFRIISFLDSFGFKMNVFFEFLFQEGSFNFQMQKKIIESFGSMFRRDKTDAEQFLQDHKELLIDKLQNKSSFIQWMNELTRPSLISELKRRNAILDQVQLSSHINVKLDETLEDAWVNIQFQVEGMDEYIDTLDNLSTDDNKTAMQSFFEEC